MPPCPAQAARRRVPLLSWATVAAATALAVVATTTTSSPQQAAARSGSPILRPGGLASSGGCPLPAPRTAEDWQRAFDRLEGDWAGGDQASTVALPDGRTLWLFGDTVVGTVAAHGGYRPGARMVHSSLVVSDAGCLHPVLGPGQTSVLPGGGDSWLWPQAAVVEGGQLLVAAARVRGTGSPAADPTRLDFTTGATELVTMAADGTGFLAVSMARLPDAHGIRWGAALLPDGATTWVYGTRTPDTPGVFGRELYLARAVSGRVSEVDGWRYFDGQAWSADPAAAQPVLGAVDGVETSVSAHRGAEGAYTVVSKQDGALGDAVVAWTAPTPSGPWSTRVLTTASSTGSTLHYLAQAHADVPLASGRLLVSVCRNSRDLAALSADALIYRPQFLEVEPV